MQVIEGLVKYTTEELLTVCPDDIDFVIKSMVSEDPQQVIAV
jgi:hypothetical protein